MSRPGRKLSREEAALWAKLTKTVAPLDGTAQPVVESAAWPAPRRVPSAPPTSRPVNQPARAPLPDRHGLDSAWDRKLALGLAQPDFTLDLHGCTLDQAHARLLHGLAQAGAMGARLVLLVTGKPRAAEPGERGQRRGAIRAKVIDWLAASEHASGIAAIRGAHRRHGGTGALYVVLRRRR